MNREITEDEFHEILKKIIEYRVTTSELLSIPEIYEALSEKYNNEILNAWEQETFDLKERLYSFAVKEVDGEREHSTNCLVLANSYEDAQKKAYLCCLRWYPGDLTWHFDDDKKIHYFDNECVCVTFGGLAETSREAWFERAHLNALISDF